MLRKIILVGVFCVALFFYIAYEARATAVSWDGNFGTQILQPLQSMWASLVKADRFQATSTTQSSVFPLADIDQLTNLTSNGFVKTSGGDGTLSVDTASYQPAGNYITALTGDVTASGPGSVAATLATVNANVGSFTYGSFTVNGKGLITAASSGAAPFTTTTNYGATANATGTPIWFQAGLQASSTSYFVNASTTLISAGSGTISIPAYSFTADPDTGIYRNTTNTISLSGGGAGVSWNGTAFYPNSSAVRDLGILSTNEWDNLYVAYASTTQLSIGSDFITDVNGTGLSLSAAGVLSASLGGAVDLASEVFGTLPIANGGTATTTMRDQGVLFYNSTLGTVSQASNVAGNALNYDYTNGHLGIGTTTPGYSLSVYGDASFGGTASPRRRVDINTNGLFTFYATDNSLVDFFTMQNGGITAAGQGLCQQYNMASSTSSTLGIYFAGAQICGISEGDYTDAAGALAGLSFYTSSNPGTVGERMRIDNEGDVGIGTTSPYAKLSVSNTGTNDSFIVEDSATPDATPVKIDNAGNFLVGTTSADYLGSKFIVWGSGGRYTEQNPNGRNRIVANDNSLAPALSLINNMSSGVSLQFQLGYGGTANIDGTTVAGGRIAALPESTYTSDTTTQNAYLQFTTAIAGVLTTGAHIRGGATDGSRQQLELVSPREAITAGEILATLGFVSNDTNLTSPGTTTASIAGVAAGTHTAAAQLTDLVFKTTSTGGTATNTEKMRLTGAGRLGIGTTTPSAVSGLTGTLLQLGGTGTNSYGNLVLSGSAATGQRLGAISFQSDGEHARIESNVINGTNDRGNLVFYTSNSVGGITERVRITETGLVGIGTTNPTTLLDVVGDLSISTTSSAAGAGQSLWFKTSTSLARAGVAGYRDSAGSGGNVRLYTTNSSAVIQERLRIDSSGNVGIGTTTPPSIFTLHGASPKETYYDTSTSELRTFTGALEKTFTYSTTTAWTGTTTIPMGPAWAAQTFSGVKCFTDTGTLNVALYDGTNRANNVNASTTVGTNTYTTNNTFTASEKRYIDVGTPASSPTSISCTFRWYEQ